MRCEHCGTLVEGSNGTCPLCGAPMMAGVPVYPPRNGRAHSYSVPFSVIFWTMAIAACVIGGAFNYVYAPSVHYWAIGLVGCWYVYGFLRHTLLGVENWHHRILGQTINGLILLTTTGFVLQAELVFSWVLPIYYLVCWIVDGVVALISVQKAHRYILSLWGQGLLSVAIFVLCFAQQLFWVPSALCGGLGLLLCFVITLLRPKEVYSQIKRTLDR